MAATDNIDFSPSAGNTAAELQRLIQHHREATALSDRLLSLINTLRSGDTAAGNEAFATLVGADITDGSNIYNTLASIEGNLNSDQTNVSKFTW